MREGRRGLGVFMGAVFTAAALTGCAIERPGISSSSLNPSPWFNFQLAPKKKEVSNHQRSIARTSTDQVTVKPAVAPVQKEIRWPELSLPGRRREAQLIPRTDDVAQPHREPPSTAFAEETIDFN